MSILEAILIVICDVVIVPVVVVSLIIMYCNHKDKKYFKIHGYHKGSSWSDY